MAIAGGRSSIGQSPGMVVGNRAIFTNDGLMNSGATATAAPANPTGITGATAAAVMLGLAGSFTPNAGGNMMLWVTGDILCGTIGSGATIQIAYGTGAAPANNAALTGTLAAKALNFVASTAAGRAPFNMMAYIAGLTVGTAYWLDLAVQNLTGGTTTIADVTVTVLEV